MVEKSGLEEAGVIGDAPFSPIDINILINSTSTNR
jgi:hypothetical protein